MHPRRQPNPGRADHQVTDHKGGPEHQPRGREDIRERSRESGELKQLDPAHQGQANSGEQKESASDRRREHDDKHEPDQDGVEQATDHVSRESRHREAASCARGNHREQEEQGPQSRRGRLPEVTHPASLAHGRKWFDRTDAVEQDRHMTSTAPDRTAPDQSVLIAAVAAAIETVLAEPSAGVVRVQVGEEILLERAWGLADRRHGIAMTPDHQIGVASGAKGFTALAVMSLVADGTLTLDTTARSILGADLPLIADDVTIGHLLAHRSGIGEYLDDDADTAEYLLPGAMSSLVSPEDYLPLLDGHPTAFPAGTEFAYCNGAFVVLSLLAQRASGVPFHELVRTRVIEPAGLSATAYLRSDELPASAALGYVKVGEGTPDETWRTNVHHLPVIGGGDGGIYTTAADMHRFWTALFAGRIVPTDWVAEMTREHSPASEDEDAYGLGFWLPEPGVVQLVGMDAGSSFVSSHVVAAGRTATALATTAESVWPVARAMQ